MIVKEAGYIILTEIKGNELELIELAGRTCYKSESNITRDKDADGRDTDKMYSHWRALCEVSELAYFNLIAEGATPQEARSVLPTSVKTEVIMTANYREWRHFFKLRAADMTGKAHPQMKELTIPLLIELHNLIPVVFDDIYEHVFGPF